MDNIQVFMRIRPLSEDEYRRDRTTESAVRFLSESTVSIPSQRTENFTFDFVGNETCTQQDVFDAVGRRAVERCMQGYNGTIFAYGQTGSGKTFTMQGARDEFTGPTDELRGLIPRCFEYLFERISEEEVRTNGRVKYLCRASYVEIYNETIYDLLDPVMRTCAVREDIKRGVFIDNVTEETVQDPTEAYDVFMRGTHSRHVSATAMNRESSRSHSLLMLVIQSMTQTETDGLTEVRESVFNLVDLAGSERQKLANTTGLRLKEAANINKSLSTLGNVINSLVDINSGKSRHVNYRDSKLTFLLRDSLGGNSVTFIIANVSPAMCNDAETASTLRFAQRAKMIRNKAVVNHDMQGNVPQLQAEIQRLKQQLEQAQLAQPHSAAVVSENTHSGGPSIKEHATAQYLLLLALRKLQESESQRSRYAEIICELKESLDRKRRQIQQQNLVLKLHKAEIDTLRRNSPEHVVSNAENATLREEISSLQSMLSAQPDYTDLLIENMQLNIELDWIQKSQEPPAVGAPVGISRNEAQQALDTLVESRLAIVDICSDVPIIPDDSVYDGLEERIKQARHQINDLELHRDKLEFQIASIEEDWQYVSDGIRDLANAATPEMAASIAERTMDSIVGDQARNAWSSVSAMHRNLNEQ
ncbi:Kinesin-like protein kif15 [Coemansia erecta]|uniref:Kinesin-like protein n=1 Tax=Coemansia erecta TaxID=147472 RepID=A0A9W8CTE5_9FUNG|nr:Kinesin-like protein kif15 [Coemansia erecta]